METRRSKWSVIYQVIRNKRTLLDSTSIDYLREQNTVVKLSAAIVLAACALLASVMWQVSKVIISWI